MGRKEKRKEVKKLGLEEVDCLFAFEFRRLSSCETYVSICASIFTRVCVCGGGDEEKKGKQLQKQEKRMEG